MVDQATTTLETQPRTVDSPVTPAVQSHVAPADSRSDFLFDSIAREGIGSDSDSASPWKTAFTGLLWTGYGIAVIVAIVLVWSAAKELLQ